MSRQPTTIYRAIDPYEAHLLRDLLADYDISSLITGEPLLGSAEWPHAAGGFRVLVAKRDAELAERIADAFQRHIVQTHIPDEELHESLPLDWVHWPVCPCCDQRRQTICPTCRTAGTEFHLAEMQPLTSVRWRHERRESGSTDQTESPNTEILLMCVVCDEAFAPRFYQICPWCGHDFGEGLEATDAILNEPSGKTRALLIGLGAAFAALCGYLWLLSS